MHKNCELRDVCSVSNVSSKKLSRCRSFHFRYLELCRAKNLTPLADIRAKNNATSMLDFFGDKLSVNDWLLIVEALFYDQVLQTLGIRLRKSWGMVLDHLDTEKKAKLFKQKPVIYTKFVCSGVVEAIANCIEFNKNLRVLALEGLPFNEKYVESIAKALSSNESIKEISFQRSNICDKGCEAICNTIKYLDNVERLNLAECQLTTKGAECVADMIKIQKISRYTDGWQKSLRYRDVDPDTMPGLRSITLSRNPKIGDDGVKAIVEILKEDVWVKVIDMENCGLTDRSANYILDCLELNNYIIDFNVRGNVGISKFLQRSIREQLGKDDEDAKILEAQQQENGLGANGTGAGASSKSKVTFTQLKEQLKTLEEQLAFERLLRKKAEQLNERLNQQIIAYENQLEDEANANIPDGYVVVKNDSLQSIIRERNDFQKIATSVCSSNNSVVSEPSRPKQQNLQQSGYNNNNNSNNHNTNTNNNNNNSPGSIISKEPRKLLKVRKVKSEMKYVDPVPNNNHTKKESKSDHEFANDSDFQFPSVHFETNIGDSVSNNNNSNVSTISTQQTTLQLTTRTIKKTNSKLEIDDLSISTARSLTSDDISSDSDTLRNSDNYQPMKVFIRRAKQLQAPHQQQQVGQGEGVDPNSPRTLFLGLCDD